MSRSTVPRAASSPGNERITASFPLLMLFVASGCAALIYEIVWFQLLQLSIGSSAVSLGVLLGAFMGGMCLGSLLFPRCVSAQRHPLRVYAFLEITIGLLGIASLYAIPWATSFYSQHASTGTSDWLMRAAISVGCLLPPTILMGATLPAIARWVEPTQRGASRLGFFYGANIAGAVLGCLLAGFYLLRLFNLATAVYVAVGINFAAGIVGLILAQVFSYKHHEQVEVTEASTSNAAAISQPRSRRLVYLSIALSGGCALGAEVIWTRQLALVLGATVYSFSIILAVFLTGLGIGSTAAASLSRRLRSPVGALAWCQVLAAASIAWGGFMLAKSIPFWPLLAELATSPWHVFPMDILRAACAVLPGAIFWGASFPFALAAVAHGERDTGRLVGRVYAANTVGSIVAAVGFSIFFIGWMGSQAGQRSLIVIAGISACLMLLIAQRSRTDGAATDSTPARPAIGLLGGLIAATALFTWSVPQLPPEVIGFGHRLAYFRFHEKIGNDPLPKFEYYSEGMNSSIAVSTRHDQIRSIHVNGKVVASSGLLDMRIQRMLGHLPALVHGKPKSVLIVGCGTGMTAGSFTCYPSVEKIVLCELEPRIPLAAAKYFGRENHDVMKDPRVEIHIDDARHYILSTKEKFDIITSDPIHPWAKGAASLYTTEYFELCRKKLKPGGIITQWVPLYETDLKSVQSVLATFSSSLPQVTLWCNELQLANDPSSGGQPRGITHDLVLLGQEDKMTIDVADLSQRLMTNRKALAALSELGLGDPSVLLSTFAGRGRDLKSWLTDAPINTDSNLRLQFLAGMAIGEQASPHIFTSIIERLKYPEDMFLNATPNMDRGLRRRFRQRAAEFIGKAPVEDERTELAGGTANPHLIDAPDAIGDEELLNRFRNFRERVRKDQPQNDASKAKDAKK